jgi:hypothetical protein
VSESTAHVFHTKHDFTPELGWAAFQLLSTLGRVDLSAGELATAASASASPLARRSDLRKILASLQELGLVERDAKDARLSAAGRALAEGPGAYEAGFRAAIHCVYCWKWLWDGNARQASPSWSYRQVCRSLLASSAAGVTSDDLVLQVVEAAEPFEAERVSFSRSSVNGVLSWLKAQAPPLVSTKGHRICRLPQQAPTPTALRLHLAALCGLRGGKAALDAANLELLAEGLLIPAEELWLPVVEFAREAREFLFAPGGRGTVIYQGSTVAFVEWAARRSCAAA